MSKAGMNNVSTKQENSPYKKENRGHNSDKRSSGNFSKNDRPSASPANRDRERERERRERNDHHDFEHDGQADKDKEGAQGEKKFTGRCRLFVGNLTPDISEADFRKMFETYGEISEVYVNTQRAFGFIRLDYRQNAEAAKAALDGMQKKGRILRVRFATHGAALKVKNLHSHVSNELLEQSFSQFGELERCIVIVDDRGKSTGEGIVEFVRKPGANSALRRITEGVFLMGSDPKPVSVEPLEQKDEEDGMPEKFLTRTDQYKKEREKEPRFAPPGTFEYEFGMRWKQLDELEKQRIEQVKKDTEKARIELEEEMQNALYDYQAEQIRQDLMRQQEELRRLEELRSSERLRRQQEMEMRRQKEEREMAQQDERRREMMMRQQEMAQRRSGPMDGPGMRSREEMMMAERFGDRMGERMGDRMPDRMGDRLNQGGPGGPGFNMWPEEKQRNEAQMKNMRGNEQSNRGRDMRGGPGPQNMPSQGPPQPGMERGGPGSGPAPGPQGGQNKDGPKPLMQPGSGFGGQGQGQGNNNGSGPPNNPNAPSSEQQNMDTCTSCEEDVIKACNVPNLVTSELAEESVPAKEEHCLENPSLEGVPKPPWINEKDNQNCSDFSATENNMHNEEGSTVIESIGQYSLPEDMDVSDACQDNDDATEVCDIDSHGSCEKQKYSVCDDGKKLVFDHQKCSQLSIISEKDLSPNKISTEQLFHEMENHENDQHSCDNVKDDDSVTCDNELQTQQRANNSPDDLEDRDVSSIEQCLSPNINSTIPHNSTIENVDPVVSESFHSSSITSNPPHTQQPFTSYTVTSTTSSCENLMNYQTASFSSKKSDLVPSDMDTCGSPNSQSISVTDVNDYDNKSPAYQSLPCPSKDNEESAKVDMKNESADSNVYKDSNFTDIENDESCKDYYYTSDYVSSYRQNLSENSEEMDTNNSDSDMVRVTDSNIYQSYETNSGNDYLAASTIEDESNNQWESTTCDQSLPENTPQVSSLCSQTPAELLTPSSSSAAAMSVNDSESSSQPPDQAIETRVSSSSNDEVFRTGDQTFKTTASRKAALACIAKSSGSATSSGNFVRVSGVNQSPMMSSTMHISQQQGASTIMQTQTVRGGPSGGVAQATVVQKQSLLNGGQAVVQQRTITNGGQTMLVQQHTMTNGLGGITQQTVVQQRVIPTNIAHAQAAAAMHASAMRQHAMAATHQAAHASVLQQQGIRVAQAVVGNSVFQAPPAMARRAVLHRPGGSSVLGPRLVQASPAQGSMMQRLVRQRYLGGPVLHPARGVQMLPGRPIRVKMAYSCEQLPTG